MTAPRRARIADQIQRSLADVIRLELRDPRVGMVTLTGIEISRDQSHAKAKRVLGSLKAGHTGALDPFATGLLPLVFGEATKFSRFLIDSHKSYEATLRLGQETDTGDTESPVVRTRPIIVDTAKIDDVLRRFIGVQAQVPPLPSAVPVAA